MTLSNVKQNLNIFDIAREKMLALYLVFLVLLPPKWNELMKSHHYMDNPDYMRSDEAISIV